MIREWKEKITIECSSKDLPKAIAAISGNYKPQPQLIRVTRQIQVRQIKQVR